MLLNFFNQLLFTDLLINKDFNVLCYSVWFGVWCNVCVGIMSDCEMHSSYLQGNILYFILG